MIPGCNICLYNVLYYISQYPDTKKINYDEARRILGTENEKTIRKHVRECDAIIKKANVQISEILASMLSYCDSPGMPIGMSHLELLECLIVEAAEGKSRMHGGTPKPIAKITIVHLVYIFEKPVNPPQGRPLKDTLDSLLFRGKT